MREAHGKVPVRECLPEDRHHAFARGQKFKDGFFGRLAGMLGDLGNGLPVRAGQAGIGHEVAVGMDGLGAERLQDGARRAG